MAGPEKKRDINPNEVTLAATTATTATFDKGIPKTAFRRFTFRVVGTNNSLAGSAINKYVVKKNGTEIWNITPAQFRALLEATLGPIGGSVPATSALRYTMPFDLYMKDGILGLPTDVYTVEIDVDADSSAGSIKQSFEFADVEPAAYLRMMREPMGAAASSPGHPSYIKTKAGIPVLGWILPLVSATEGIQEAWLYRAPRDGANPIEIWHGTYLDILESQAHYNPEAITNPFFWKPFDQPLDYPDGSYLKVKTGTSSVAGDEWVPVQMVPSALTI